MDFLDVNLDINLKVASWFVVWIGWAPDTLLNLGCVKAQTGFKTQRIFGDG